LRKKERIKGPVVRGNRQGKKKRSRKKFLKRRIPQHLKKKRGKATCGKHRGSSHVEGGKEGKVTAWVFAGKAWEENQFLKKQEGKEEKRFEKRCVLAKRGTMPGNGRKRAREKISGKV